MFITADVGKVTLKMSVDRQILKQINGSKKAARIQAAASSIQFAKRSYFNLRLRAIPSV